MKHFLLFVVSLSAAAQVAEKANAHYRTEEGRAQVARGLVSEERAGREKPRELIREVGLKAGLSVADVGTGAGFMLPYLSEAVGPAGRVFAQDIFADFLAKARQRAESQGLANIEFVQGTETSPNLPADAVDLVLVLDVYHHFDYPQQMLAGIRAALSRNGRLAVVDYYRRPGAMRRDDVMQHIRADEPEVIKEIEAAGFKLLTRRERVPNSQYLLIFEKKPD